MTQLTINDEAFIWGADQQEAYEHLKDRLVTAPVLSHFDEDAATPIHTDAINQALGDAFRCKPKKASRE